MARLTLVSVDADRVALTLDCSAGFYVRALARDLGERLGTGGHLVALRRTRVGTLTLDQAIPLADAERDAAATAARLIPMSLMLTDLPAMTLDADGVRRTMQGRDVPGFGIRDSGFGSGFGIRGSGFEPGFGIRGSGFEAGFGVRDSGFEPGFGKRDSGFVRLLDEAGDLVAIAVPSASAAGFLHPSVVLR